MKLNQAVAAAFVAAILESSSSLGSSVSSLEELKIKIATMFSPNHNHLHRSLQELTDQCIANIEAPTPSFTKTLAECASVVDNFNQISIDDLYIDGIDNLYIDGFVDSLEDSVELNNQMNQIMLENIVRRALDALFAESTHSACDLSLLTEACTADKGTIVGFADTVVDCTYILMGQEYQIFTFTSKGYPVCIPPSCVSYWESGKLWTDVWKEKLEKTMESGLAAKDFDVECRANSHSVVGLSSVNAGEGGGGSGETPPPTPSSSSSSTSNSTGASSSSSSLSPSPASSFNSTAATPPPAGGGGEVNQTKAPTYAPTNPASSNSSAVSTISNGTASYFPTPSPSSSGGNETYAPSPAATNTTAESTLSPSVASTNSTTSYSPTLSASSNSTSVAPTNIGTTLAPTVGTATLSPTVGTTTVSPTNGTATLSPTVGTTTVSPTNGTATLSPTDVTVTLSPTVGTTTLSPTVGSTVLSPTAPPSTLSPTPSPIAATDEPTTSTPTVPAITVFTNPPTVTSVTIFTNPPTPSPKPTLVPAGNSTLEPTSPSPTLPQVVTADNTGFYHQKEAEENVIPHLDHSKVSGVEMFVAEEVERFSSPHLFGQTTQEEEEEVVEPMFFIPLVKHSKNEDDGVETPRVSSPHLIAESEAAERLRSNEIPYAVEDSSEKEPMEDAIAAFASYKYFMPGSTVTQSSQSNAAPPIGSLDDGDLSHRVRMNGSSVMMWNIVAALGSVGITWMLLQ